MAGVLGKAMAKLGRKTGPKDARVPPFRRIYAIGDIHGRLDLLDDLLAQIAADRDTAGAVRPLIVFLGDYVDRGPDSRGVIERLMDPPPGDFDAVHLLGNHEEMMLRFFTEERAGLGWLANGGNATLASYGVELDGEVYRREQLVDLRQRMIEAVPPAHLDFLDNLKLTHREGDYLFVHAGIRPGTPLNEQDQDDLIWIREEFLDSKVDHGAVVVHGHSIRPEVEMRRNRIGIDTGAYSSGKLTCLVLQDDERTLLQT